MKKIIIFGFPHCGTTILRCIIGHIEDVYEIVDETQIINEDNIYDDNIKLKKYILCKKPFTKNIYFTDDKYKDYIKIFIIRNPLYVFTSINKRFPNHISGDHSINCYIESLRYFIKYKNNPIENLYLIKYEDLFHNNYENLKNILNKIGFIYNDDIFDNNKYINKCQFTNDSIPKTIPIDTDHHAHRLYQINKPFVNNNNDIEINLKQHQINLIKNNKDILSIYPEISTFFP
jgi:hypothetical protein